MNEWMNEKWNGVKGKLGWDMKIICGIKFGKTKEPREKTRKIQNLSNTDAGTKIWTENRIHKKSHWSNQVSYRDDYCGRKSRKHLKENS